MSKCEGFYIDTITKTFYDRTGRPLMTYHDSEFAEYVENLLLERWISVKERLPDRNTPILITANGKVYTATLFDANGIEYWSVNNRGNSHDPSTKVERVKAKAITHWMPLPETPKEEVDRDELYRAGYTNGTNERVNR